jgi:hypothetical protein
MRSTTLWDTEPFIGLSFSRSPFDDELAFAIHMHMPRRVVPFPGNEDVAAAADLPHMK